MDKQAKQENNLVDATPVLNNPGPIMTKKDIKPKQIYHKVQLNQENTLRQQLLGNRENTKSELFFKSFSLEDLKK